MLKNIREIGIFMIAAQTVIHFAPGKQYEKYIKSVSGIMILLLFLRPFLQLSGAEWSSPEAALGKLEELTDMPDFLGGEWKTGREGGGQTDAGVGSTALGRMETEVKALLNLELEGDDYRVKRVSIQLAKDSAQGSELSLSQVKIELVNAAETEEEQRIFVDRIVIGEAADSEEESAFLQYRSRFAALLGIEEERVEVRQGGRS